MVRNWRKRDIIAAVVGTLTAISIAQAGAGAIDFVIGIGINVGIVYGVAAIIDWNKNRNRSN